MDVLTSLKRFGSAIENSSIVARWTKTERHLRRWTWASLVANIGIIVTGAIVRLTGSGLGCPTWPRCTPASYVPHDAVSYHPLIEFGNRLLTFVLIAIALGCWLTARRVTRTTDVARGWAGSGRLVRRLARIVLIGIPFQGIIGGITVLTDLNPFVVALHLLLSLALVALLVRLLFAVYRVVPDVVGRLDRAVAVATFAAMALACWLGTVVTGSGPHAGDGGVARTGFNIEFVARLHSLSVWATIGLTVLLLVRSITGHHETLRRWVSALLVVEVMQGGIGYWQYFTGLPAAVVLAHMLGAGVAVAAAAAVLFSTTQHPIENGPGAAEDSPEASADLGTLGATGARA